MKLLSFTLLAVGLASVSALPAVIVGGSSDNIEMQPRGGGAGFQNYVIPAGPTGVDLAGALNEIQGYGVSCCLFIYEHTASADLVQPRTDVYVAFTSVHSFL